MMITHKKITCPRNGLENEHLRERTAILLLYGFFLSRSRVEPNFYYCLFLASFFVTVFSTTTQSGTQVAAG